MQLAEADVTLKDAMCTPALPDQPNSCSMPWSIVMMFLSTQDLSPALLKLSARRTLEGQLWPVVPRAQTKVHLPLPEVLRTGLAGLAAVCLADAGGPALFCRFIPSVAAPSC